MFDRILIALLICVSAITTVRALRGQDCTTAAQLLLPEGD